MSVPARTQTSSIAPSRVRSLLIIAVGLFAADGVWACTTPVSVCERDSAGAVALIRSEVPATVVSMRQPIPPYARSPTISRPICNGSQAATVA